MAGDLERLAHMSGPPFEKWLGITLKRYWADRFDRHLQDLYAGVPLVKMPEDLRVYEHLLWASKPNVVIEIGAYHGGGALWFRDRLRTLADHGLVDEPKVLSIDVDVALARERLDGVSGVSLIAGDVLDPDLPDRVAELLPPDARCFVVEDSAHTYDTTMAALNGFSRFVAPGGFFIVEDGCVDDLGLRVHGMRLASKRFGPFRWRRWPHGVLPAIADWLPGSGFTVRRDLELYGLTCHPGGILQREVAA